MMQYGNAVLDFEMWVGLSIERPSKCDTLFCNIKLSLKCQLFYFWRTEEIVFDRIYPSEIHLPNKSEC